MEPMGKGVRGQRVGTGVKDGDDVSDIHGAVNGKEGVFEVQSNAGRGVISGVGPKMKPLYKPDAKSGGKKKLDARSKPGNVTERKVKAKSRDRPGIEPVLTSESDFTGTGDCEGRSKAKLRARGDNGARPGKLAGKRLEQESEELESDRKAIRDKLKKSAKGETGNKNASKIAKNAKVSEKPPKGSKKAGMENVPRGKQKDTQKEVETVPNKPRKGTSKGPDSIEERLQRQGKLSASASSGSVQYRNREGRTITTGPSAAAAGGLETCTPALPVERVPVVKREEGRDRAMENEGEKGAADAVGNGPELEGGTGTGEKSEDEGPLRLEALFEAMAEVTGICDVRGICDVMNWLPRCCVGGMVND